MRFLKLNHTRITNLGPLSALVALKELDINHTLVNDLQPIASLTSIQTLDFNGTHVSNPAPLIRLTGLRTLTLPKEEFTAAQEDAFRSYFPFCQVSRE